jgi:polyisoprenoid-binding protein YceI
MFFIDQQTIDYLKLNGREDKQVRLVETYAKHVGLWGDCLVTAAYERTLSFDLSTVVRNMAGPSNPHARVATTDLASKGIAANLDQARAQEAAGQPSAEAGVVESTEEDTELTDADGTGRVDTGFLAFDSASGSGTWVGYRIDEELSTVGAFTAVGRTPLVDGTVTIEDGAVVTAEVTADLTGLASDSGTRDSRVRPLFDGRPAVFTLLEPVEVGEVPAQGQRLTTAARGLLRIGAVEREVVVELSAEVVGTRLVVTGSTPVALADFDVRVPSAPIVISVSDTATVELQLFLVRG